MTVSRTPYQVFHAQLRHDPPVHGDSFGSPKGDQPQTITVSPTPGHMRSRDLIAARKPGDAVPAVALIACLLVNGAFAVWFGRPFYADGAYYLLSILATGDYLHVAWARIGATTLSQTPLILALRAGVVGLSMAA
jgi:hypothetical protein